MTLRVVDGPETALEAVAAVAGGLGVGLTVAWIAAAVHDPGPARSLDSVAVVSSSHPGGA